MTKDHGRSILREIIEGLEGVTPSPWFADGRYVFTDTRGQVCCGRGVEVGCPEGGSMLECCGNPVIEGDYYVIAESRETTSQHIARCSPDAMRAIAEYVSGLEREIERLHLSNQTVADELGNEISRLQRELADEKESVADLLAETKRLSDLMISYRLSASDARRKAFAEAAEIAEEHTPRKHEGTLAAHVTGSMIAHAIRSRAEG